MSRQLLLDLNGRNEGPFQEYIEGLQSEPRIAWYPSCGIDFRPLLYLHPSYATFAPQPIPEPPPPEIFLYTDYYCFPEQIFFRSKLVLWDNRTKITVGEVEELPWLDLPLNGGIVQRPALQAYLGRAFFLKIKVESKQLGDFIYPVLYIIAENEAFCAQKILPQRGRISHLVHRRYGYSAGGGGLCSGIWLYNVLKRMGCQVLISDGIFNFGDGDRLAMKIFPSLAGNCRKPRTKMIRTLKWCDESAAWFLL